VSDFRYHLVSIIAVFLALAVGIVVGSTALRPAVVSSLNKAESAVEQQIKSVTRQNNDLNQQVSADQAFAQAGAGRLVGHLLTGQSVVLVIAPGADSQLVSGVTGMVTAAGATITGQVLLQQQFFDASDSTETKLTALAAPLAVTAGVTLAQPQNGDPVTGQEAAAQVLAPALAEKAAGTGLTASQGQGILAAFAQSGYLRVSPASGSGTTLAPATLAIVLEPDSPPSTSGSSPANQALLAVASQLQAGSAGTVLTGSLAGSGPGSAIDAATGAGKVSTVDNADSAVGQIVVIQTLAELLSGHAPASYGGRPGAVPSPAPTPSESATASPATSPTPPVRKK
jgi:hypothetical protein